MAELEQSDPETAANIDLKNARRVIRALETVGMPKVQSQLLPGAILIGLRPVADELDQRIARRTKQMLASGLKQETEAIIKRYGDAIEVLRSPGYAEVTEGPAGTELESLISLHTRQLAKRQLTWLRRNPDINWCQSGDEAYEFVASKLAAKRL